MYSGLHVQCLSLLSEFSETWVLSTATCTKYLLEVSYNIIRPFRNKMYSHYCFRCSERRTMRTTWWRIVRFTLRLLYPNAFILKAGWEWKSFLLSPQSLIYCAVAGTRNWEKYRATAAVMLFKVLEISCNILKKWSSRISFRDATRPKKSTPNRHLRICNSNHITK
jgi:hypothetical protein